MTTRMPRWITATALVALIALAGTVQASDRWLHVRVDGDDEQVRVNIPLALIETMLPMIETDELHGGTLQFGHEFGHGALDDLDLREILTAIRDTPDADFVTVRDGNETVRIAKEAGFLLVDVNENRARGEQVEVRVPIEVVEALLGAGGGRLDLAAGLRALAAFDGQSLVSVESDDESVRVWIDSSDSGD